MGLLRKMRVKRRREAMTPKLNPEMTFLLCDKKGSEKMSFLVESMEINRVDPRHGRRFNEEEREGKTTWI